MPTIPAAINPYPADLIALSVHDSLLRSGIARKDTIPKITQIITNATLIPLIQ
jgi:hypothetical protein